ncbi:MULTISPECIES: hypothetical protein [Trichocoleus]|uniref:Uncharacterized protein n=1 Tax=Trichocoleus desertorum GB2-A4 TaxID=2933944 RepID=A0ABV0JA56_9CYAN|nr:hypothetical protein [Trichocoleus sp. FACHB-46]MBD1861384.1 hypothetical protein [Trichocoleus sp. FACHB-46]
METAVHQDSLQVLARQLQQHLQSELGQPVPIQIQCALKQGVLMILGQHSPGINPPTPQSVFTLLEQALESLQPDFSDSEFNYTVRLYLRVAGQKQPYASHSLTLEPTAPAELLEGDVATPPDNSANTSHNFESTNALLDTEIADPPDLNDAEDNPFGSAIQPLTEPRDEIVPTHKPSKPDQRTRLPLLVAGAGVGLFALAGVIYALTRPCVIGGCPAIATAQQLSQESAKILRTTKSGQEVLTAQQKLETATQALAPIPAWSGHHGEAQTLLNTYQAQEQAIAQVVAAQNQAIAAAQKSQNPPHPLADWTEIQKLWRGAITQLEAVPKISTAYPVAQKKLKEYRANLVMTNKRAKLEQQANATLAKAKSTAQVAEARQGIAQSLASWQLADATWRMSTNTLRQVPRGTMAYQEAQQLLGEYQPKILAARDRKTKEQLSVNAYRQAVNLARQAQSFEQQNQWSQAVANWRDALAAAKQVPTDSLFYNQAQPLISSYGNSLTEAENKLSLANILEGARADLRRTCAGSPRVCDFAVSLALIKVQLNPDHVRKLVRTAITAEANGDIGTQVDVRDHIQTLEAALEAISENANIAIELYDENGSLLGRYVPSLAQ